MANHSLSGQTIAMDGNTKVSRFRRLCITRKSEKATANVEPNLAKVGVEGSNPFARSKFSLGKSER